MRQGKKKKKKKAGHHLPYHQHLPKIEMTHPPDTTTTTSPAPQRAMRCTATQSDGIRNGVPLPTSPPRPESSYGREGEEGLTRLLAGSVTKIDRDAGCG